MATQKGIRGGQGGKGFPEKYFEWEWEFSR